MLGYIEGRPAIAPRRSSPNVLLVIIVVHVTLIALVMSTKMDLGTRIKEGPLIVDLIPEPTPPPPDPVDAQVPRQPIKPTITQSQQIVPLPPTSAQTVDSTPIPGAEVIGPVTDPQPVIEPLPTPAPVRSRAQLLTSASDLKPPYPPSKLLTEEEADLRLSLTIDANGRVVAVDPIGHADPAFLSAARRHLIARWRFRPASEDGRPVESTTEITLRFRLD